MSVYLFKWEQQFRLQCRKNSMLGIKMDKEAIKSHKTQYFAPFGHILEPPEKLKLVSHHLTKRTYYLEVTLVCV